MSAGRYSPAMPYLEDIGVDDVLEVLCLGCEVEDEQEGTAYRDSETFRWQCSHCGSINDKSLPDGFFIDPDTIHDSRSDWL